MGRRKRKPSGDPVDGILLLDKPEGITSNAVSYTHLTLPTNREV